MVNTQAHSMLIVTPHLTAQSRLVAPTPLIDPVIVCVVLTGIPRFSVRNRVNAPAVVLNLDNDLIDGDGVPRRDVPAQDLRLGEPFPDIG